MSDMIRYTMFGHPVTPAQRDKIEHVGIQQWTDTHPRLVTRWIAEYEALPGRWSTLQVIRPRPRYLGE